jgi:hypothetical protein
MTDFLEVADGVGVPDEIATAWERFKSWSKATWGPPAKAKDVVRAEQFGTPALVDFIAGVFSGFLSDRTDVGGHKHVAYALWLVIAARRHDAIVLDHAERHFRDRQYLNALRVRRYVGWRDGKTPSELLLRLDGFAQRTELVTNPARRFAETLKLKFDPREPWQFAFTLKDERLKSLIGPRPLPHPVLDIRMSYPGGMGYGWDWSCKLQHVFGSGEVVWRQGAAAPEVFSRDAEVEARLRQ